jgi:CubicO group peptidase (beta-lactamase class C family)
MGSFKKKKSVLIVIILLLCLVSSIWAIDYASQVDKLFARWDRTDSPGCVLAVVKDGRMVYRNGYGMANLELDVPLTPQSVFYIGSVSKQFVAMCIALLSAEGKLNLDDDIHKYIPEIPDYGVPIKIRNLIHHTGGIRDYLELENIAGIPFGFYHQKEVIRLIARQKELNFTPGAKYTYSNSGYFLLGVVVERASGKSLRAFADEHIFKPLGMRNSRFHDDYSELIKNRATGYYHMGKEVYRNFLSTFDCVGSGGLYTSVEDLFLWDQNFYHYKVGGEDIIQLMHTQGDLNNGQRLEYAFGLQIKEYRGLRVVEHGGSLGGYRAELIRFPDLRFSVIILSNLNSINPARLSRQVADIYLAGKFTEEKPEPKRRSAERTKKLGLPREKLVEYTGDFFSQEIRAGFQVIQENGKLYLKRPDETELPMRALSADRFLARGWTVRFERGAQGMITSFRMDSGRVKNLLFVREENKP